MGCAGAASAGTIDAVITVDNHYALYVGNASGSEVLFVGNNEIGAGGEPGQYNWSQPESYLINTEFPIIYVAAWSDDNVAQGVLAQLLIEDEMLLSGDPAWQVFRTDLGGDDGDPPPTTAEIAEQIALANAGLAWEAVAVGGTNGVSPWGTIAGIDLDAHWMWATACDGGSFDPGADHGEYLIFRITVPEPTSIALLIFGLAAGLRKRH
jgi:hypothetical protein